MVNDSIRCFIGLSMGESLTNELSSGFFRSSYVVYIANARLATSKFLVCNGQCKTVPKGTVL